MIDTVNQMLNETSKKRDRIKMIHIDDMLPNQHNVDFPMTDIEDLALSLRICGQIDPCVVTPQGDNYRLVSGERRWRAAKYNVEQGYTEWEELSCIVRECDQEELHLIAANGTRESISVDRKIEITGKVLKHYYEAKSKGEIPTGTKKREWISAVTGYSERSVQSYLSKIEIEGRNNDHKIKQPDIFLLSLENQMMERLSTQVKVTDRYIKISHGGTEDLNRILELMGLLEEEL